MLSRFKSKINDYVNIYDSILHVWYSGILELASKDIRSGYSKSGFKAKLFNVIKELGKSVILLFKDYKIPSGKIIAFVSSKNNYNAVSFINIENFIFVEPKRNLKDVLKCEYKFNYRFRVFYLLAFPIYFLIYYSFSGKREHLLKYWDIFFKTVGKYEESKRILKKIKPAGIVFSNDHNIEQRSLLLACNKLKIKTAYIQHASVSNYFPPLSFDLNLLDGQDSLDKYKQIGPISGIVELIGMPKFDNYLSRVNKSLAVRTVGICINKHDIYEKIKEMVEIITTSFPSLNIILRPHPIDRRDFSKFCENISNSKQELVFDFLSRVDAIIASNSSIHLEAALLNVTPIYYRFSDEFEDYYGFAKNNLVIWAKDINSLVNAISNLIIKKENVRDKARYYVDTIGTENEGKSQELAISNIKMFFNS